MSVVVSELNLGNETEVLSREQLKKVLGGAGSGGTTIPQTTGGSDNGCPDSQKRCSGSCTGKCTSSDGTTVEVSGSCGWTGATSTCTCGYAC